MKHTITNQESLNNLLASVTSFHDASIIQIVIEPCLTTNRSGTSRTESSVTMWLLTPNWSLPLDAINTGGPDSEQVTRFNMKRMTKILCHPSLELVDEFDVITITPPTQHSAHCRVVLDEGMWEFECEHLEIELNAPWPTTQIS